jgi:fucose permease
MNLGLIIALTGLVIPIFYGMNGSMGDFAATHEGKFYILLLAILLLGAGATTLQVVGNPIMRDVSTEGKYSSNLSFAQSIKAVGSSLGFLIPPVAVQFFHLDWTILFPVYSALIFVNLIWFNSAGFSNNDKLKKTTATFKTCFGLLLNRYVLMMVLAIFLYVGAEVSMSSGVPILMKEQFGVQRFGLWVTWALFFLPILTGRFTGGVILRIVSPRKFLIITVILALAGMLFMFSGNKILTFTGIVMTGLGFANIFPLIFSISIDRMPDRSNELSGLMVSAIVGGALLPLLMGYVADRVSVTSGFLVPLAAVIYIFFVALKAK